MTENQDSVDKKKFNIREGRLNNAQNIDAPRISNTEDFINAIRHQPRLIEEYSAQPDASVRDLITDGLAPPGNTPYVKAFPGMDSEVYTKDFSTDWIDLIIHDISHLLVNAFHTPGLAGEVRVGLVEHGIRLAMGDEGYYPGKNLEEVQEFLYKAMHRIAGYEVPSFKLSKDADKRWKDGLENKDLPLLPEKIANETFVTAIYYGHKWKDEYLADSFITKDQVRELLRDKTLIKIIPERVVANLKEQGHTLDIAKAREIFEDKTLDEVLDTHPLSNDIVEAMDKYQNKYIDTKLLSERLKEYSIEVSISDLDALHDPSIRHQNQRFSASENWAGIHGSILQDALHPSELQISKEERQLIQAIASGEEGKLSELLETNPHLEKHARMAEQTISGLRSQGYMAGQRAGKDSVEQKEDPLTSVNTQNISDLEKEVVTDLSVGQTLSVV